MIEALDNSKYTDGELNAAVMAHMYIIIGVCNNLIGS